MLHSHALRYSVMLLLLLPAVAVPTQDTHDWPQFRGRNVDGIARERDVFGSRPPALETSWKRPLGSGYSGISVAGGVAVTMFTDGESNILIAFDARTGRESWRFPFSPVYKGHDGSYDGPMSTPLIDGNLTIALGPTGRLFAVDNLDGERRTIATREARAHAGAGGSAHDAGYCAFRYPALSAKLAVQSFVTADFGWEKLEPLITIAEEHPLKLHIEWGRYDLRSPHEDLDTGEITRAFVAFLEGRGYEVEAFEVADGSGWPAWRNRNDVILASLFPLTGAE